MAIVQSINLGRAAPNPDKQGLRTGIHKQPHEGPVELRAPGPKHGGLGSGLVGDHIGDRRSHGGGDQAVYAFAREDLDRWQVRLDRELPNGSFGENLTTIGIDLTEAVMGERWRVGETVELIVTYPRIPCVTFAGKMAIPGWLKTFTADGRPGAYLRVVVPGPVRAGDPIEVLDRPDHGVTIGLAFQGLTTDRSLHPRFLEAEQLMGGTTSASS